MRRLAVIGMGIIAILIIIALLAPVIATHDPTEINLKEAYLPPSSGHYFGTDGLGRDLYSRIVYGTRIALMIGIVALGIATIIGIALGSIAGYFGGKADSIIMRFVDIMLCFPSFFLILSVIAFIGPNILNVMIIIGATSWMGIARLIRAEVLSLKSRDFIVASRALGRSNFYIILRHIIPNGIGPVLVNFVFGVAAAILTEVALSFLGLGVQPPNPSWGNILIEGKEAMAVCWWIVMFPGMAILVTVMAFNLLGEGIRDMLNPRLRK